MANETGNLTMLTDDGRIFQAYCSTAVSAGQLVACVSGDDVVGSGTTASASDYSISDIKIVPKSGTTGADGYKHVIGIALEDGAAGDKVAVATRGIFIMQGSAVTAGAPVVGAKAAEKPYTVVDAGSGDEPYVIGRALTGTSDDNKLCIVRLNI